MYRNKKYKKESKHDNWQQKFFLTVQEISKIICDVVRIHRWTFVETFVDFRSSSLSNVEHDRSGVGKRTTKIWKYEPIRNG